VVEFAGYSIPHPLEDKMQLRLQTRDGTSAVETLENAFDTIQGICEHVLSVFDARMEE
jgi:DNA-directed RNA polymerases I and III subunit RPAC2